MRRPPQPSTTIPPATATGTGRSTLPRHLPDRHSPSSIRNRAPWVEHWMTDSSETLRIQAVRPVG